MQHIWHHCHRLLQHRNHWIPSKKFSQHQLCKRSLVVVWMQIMQSKAVPQKVRLDMMETRFRSWHFVGYFLSRVLHPGSSNNATSIPQKLWTTNHNTDLMETRFRSWRFVGHFISRVLHPWRLGRLLVEQRNVIFHKAANNNHNTDHLEHLQHWITPCPSTKLVLPR